MRGSGVKRGAGGGAERTKCDVFVFGIIRTIYVLILKCTVFLKAQL